MGTPQQLTFNDEGIQDLAKDVAYLLGEITTMGDGNKGNLPDFATAADIAPDVKALAGGGATAYADAYHKEHAAVGDLYQTLQGQLRSLQQLLATTGRGYQTSEGQAKQVVARTNPGAGPTVPLGTTGS